MKPSIIGSSANIHELHQAILVYRERAGWDKETYAITIHDVSLVDGVPLICPGLAATSAQIADFARNLTESVSDRCIFSDRVLFADPGMLMWWTPAQERAMFFGGDAKLKKQSPLVVHHPPLFFRATEGRLEIFALKENQRPGSETGLCRAPYMNIWDSGNMCRGNVRYPDQIDPSEDGLTAWEDAFFQSRFTHSNYNEPMLAKGNHDAVWRSLAKSRKPFPVNLLVELPLSVSGLLNRGAK